MLSESLRRQPPIVNNFDVGKWMVVHIIIVLQRIVCDAVRCAITYMKNEKESIRVNHFTLT